MKLAVTFAFALAAATTLAGCKKDKKASGDQGTAPAIASGSADGSSAAGSATPPPAPPPPPPPVVPAGPTVADITKQIGAVLAQVASGIDVATMHGCSEAQDRVAELFEKADEAEADDLHRWLVDPKLLAEAQALIKDAKDPAIAEPLARIDAAIKDCKKAVDVVAEWKTKLVEPL